MIFFSYCFREKLTTIAQYLVTFCCCCRLNGVHFVVFYDFSVCLFVSGFWSFRWTHTFCLIRMIARARAQTNNLFVSFAFFWWLSLLQAIALRVARRFYSQICKNLPECSSTNKWRVTQSTKPLSTNESEAPIEAKICHSQVSRHNRQPYFSVWSCWFVADDVWTWNENDVCHSMDFIEFKPKTAQLFVAWKFVEMQPLLLLLSLFLYLSVFQANPTGQHWYWLASTQSFNGATARTDARTHTHSIFLQYSFEWRRFVYFAAFTLSFHRVSVKFRWPIDERVVFTLVRLSLGDVTYLIHK